ncbi:MAG: aminotransferase class III-fold pyridoxal phosphate-dependent enzyme [Myxococcota bacterium]
MESAPAGTAGGFPLGVVSHPFFFTWKAQRNARPVQITGGKGAWFEADGERILDFGSLIYQANAGHGHARIVEAVREQAARLCLSLPAGVYPGKTELAERLIGRMPEGFGRILFTLGGSDANENALKIARLFTGRHKVITRYRSYHGATMGAVTMTGDWRRSPVEPGLVGVVHVLDLDPAVVGSVIPRTIELEGPDTIAAVCLESVVGGNGVLIPPAGYLRSVREACDAHGILLIMDEVLAGFGRTGRWFGFEHFDDVVPDMVTMGKALTAGYGTLGAVAVHERVASHFEENTLVTGLTHTGHPLGVAAALEAIKVYEDERLVARAADCSRPFSECLKALVDGIPAATGYRSIGLLGAVDLRLDAEGFRALTGALRQERIHAHIPRRGGCLILAPPLCISDEELHEGFRRLRRALADRKPVEGS